MIGAGGFMKTRNTGESRGDDERKMRDEDNWMIKMHKTANAARPKEVSESSSYAFLYGGAYNFKHQPERLKYIGKHNGWNQFEKVGEQGVWCELLDSDLHMIEETKDT